MCKFDADNDEQDDDDRLDDATEVKAAAELVDEQDNDESDNDGDDDDDCNDDVEQVNALVWWVETGGIGGGVSDMLGCLQVPSSSWSSLL